MGALTHTQIIGIEHDDTKFDKEIYNATKCSECGFCLAQTNSLNGKEMYSCELFSWRHIGAKIRWLSIEEVYIQKKNSRCPIELHNENVKLGWVKNTEF